MESCQNLPLTAEWDKRMPTLTNWLRLTDAGLELSLLSEYQDQEELEGGTKCFWQ